MPLKKQQCREVRIVINRAHMGPAWMSDDHMNLGPEGRALYAELRTRTREWLRANVIDELQRMMPPEERVKLLKQP